MPRWLTFPLLFALGCSGGDPSGRVGVREGSLAPSFSALTLEGKSMGLQDLAGKPAVIIFWASWCGPCRAEIPHVNEIVQAYGDRVHVLGINLGEDARAAATVSSSMQYPSILDFDSTIGNRYAVNTIPLVLILDAEGRIRYRGNGLPGRPHVLLDGILGS